LTWSTVEDAVGALLERGLIESDGRHCRPTERGMSFLNDALLVFLPQSTAATALSVLSTAS
jgi:hypothetical protein